MPADLGWRYELLTNRCRVGGVARVSLLTVTSLASILLALFHIAFAAYLLGWASLAERRFLSGLGHYADELDRPLASVIAAIIIGGLGVVLGFAALARPVSPTVANLATAAVGVWAVLWFWLGAWPVGLVAVIGSTVDLAIRGPRAASAGFPN